MGDTSLGVPVQLRYSRLIRQLPELRARGNKKNHHLDFSFADGDGILMGVNVPEPIDGVKT